MATVSEKKATPANSVQNKKPSDRETISRTVQILKYKLNEVYKDSLRQRPLFSDSAEIAKARYNAAVRSLTEFAETLIRN